MNIFIILSLISLLAAWLTSVFFNSKKFRWKIYIPFITFFFVVLQVIFTDFQFQMIIVYLLSIIFLLRGIYKLCSKKDTEKRRIGVLRIVGIILFTFVVIIAIAIPILFPVSPSPTGAYCVANTTFEWIDKSRFETLTAETDDYRDLLVQVWYPVDKCGDTTISNNQSTYPVLIFSHGFGMAIDNYALEIEDIASHGYIIFGINHPYEASVVIYPDGRVAELSTEIIASLQSEKQKTVNSLIEQYKSANDSETKQDLFVQIDTLSWEMTEESINTWVTDTTFVLDKIEGLNKDSESFAGRLNLDEVGVFGHSFGGSVAGMVCIQDQRFKAGINMDGMQFGQLTVDSSLHTPFMEMTSDDIIPGINDFIYDQGDNWVYRLHINGSKHNNFTDMALDMPLFRQSKVLSCGTIDPFKMRKIVDSYILAFFDTYLKNMDSVLLKGPDSSMSEVEFSIYSPND